ncbi:E3 ubiquitin-protein ligase RSL1-like [Bidens hawaiensis]|uniref:E3 ubiquitin-protein ligase RSL1-like n=1 Tax=Bidens hawaiensis TaxID=980011 RepID=UPI004049A3C5
MDDTDLMILLSEQRRELTTAIATDSDLDFAFQLQMREALNASSPSSTHQHPLLLLPEITNNSIASLLANELDDFDRQRLDHDLAQSQARTSQDNLNRLIHDQAFARHIQNVPEHEWVQTGDNIERPYGLCTSEECFKVYVSGLVSDETVMGVGVMMFGGIGVAVCDSCDCCVFELGKPVVVDGGVDGDVVEVMALVEGLTAASTLGLNRVHVYCHSDSVYHYLTGKGQPPTHKVKTLVDQLSVIQRKFAYCGPILGRQNNIKFAYKLARDAIKSEANKFANRISGKTSLEQCIICFDSIYSGQMFLVNKCLHRYCFSCMRKHVEAKLLQGKLPECPHENCKTELEIESCKQFLTSELNDIMCLRVKEASIPPTDKVYCPFSNCSFLMSKTELQEYMVYTPGSSSTAAMGPGMRKCVKCDRRFCINCKVPWHDDYTCERYMKCFPHRSVNEAKLKALATRNRWRACTKCKNLVELSEGCYHISCRCGYEFCYTCGAEWINKKPTCRCPLWEERNIIE